MVGGVLSPRRDIVVWLCPQDLALATVARFRPSIPLQGPALADDLGEVLEDSVALVFSLATELWEK
jgi:hypothetical protein